MSIARVRFNSIEPEPGPVLNNQSRGFSEEELKVIRERYERDGPAAVAAVLRRPLTSVYRKARKLGLTRDGRQTIGKNPEVDHRLEQLWPTIDPRGRGEVAKLAAELGRPRWWVSRRARDLGLAEVHRKEPDWSPAEVQLLQSVPLHRPDKAAEIFREHGFNRTPTSIVVKSKRVGLSRRYTETLSAHAAAKILGVDGKTMTLWLFDGELPATRRGTNRVAEQGGDAWSITRADLRRFVVEHPERIDIRKVEKFEFIALLAEGAPSGSPPAMPGPAGVDDWTAGQLDMRERCMFTVSAAMRSVIHALEPRPKGGTMK